MNTNIIETDSLTKGVGSQTRVNHIDLRVPEGCVYGFLGPNGAGKTTTLKLLLGLLKPTDGTITFFGQKMTGQNRLSILKHTGSLIESPSFYGHLTGLENLEIVAKMKKIPAKEISNVLQTVRLYEQKDKKVRQYSLGMKQRLGIAMALLGNPRVLILDEPTNGLDPAGIQEIREFIKNLPVLRQMTVIVSSHLLSEVEQMADMVGIINHGRLIFQGTMAALEAQGETLEDAFLKLTGGGDSL
ncbi:MAG: ATP-binding cassette domain-containing protein [Lachnospiraceae bacterium]|jgi:ABC-2 type transport system ATP-binding protein|nr:ATP-binding cassette domain-containing protein [Lachnospiraceae bacterium]